MSKTETRRVNIFINQGEAEQGLERLKQKSAALRESMKSMTEGTEEFVERTKKLRQAEANLEKYRQAADRLAEDQAMLTKGTKEYIEVTKRLKEADKFIKSTEAEVSKLKISQDELNDSAKKLKDYETNMKSLADKISGKVAPSVRDMRAQVANLRRELDGLPVGSDEFIKKTAEYQAVNGRLREVTASVNDTRSAMDKWKLTLKNIFMADVVSNLVSEGVMQMIQSAWMFMGQLVDGAAKLSDQISDIQKTTGMTVEAAEALNKSFSGIDTRTSSSDLREMAVAAGRLGVAEKDILKFVEATNKINVALGDDFKMSAEEIGTILGKIGTLYADDLSDDVGIAMTQIGSDINHLASISTASAPEMADFMTRMGQLGSIGPDFSQTMGLAAALTGDLGISSQIAAGGLTNLFLVGGKEAAAFADQMGMPEQAFRDLLNTNPNEMLLQLAESFVGLDTDQTVEAMNRMKIGTQESVKVIASLSENLDFVKKQQAEAADALAKNTSITDEAAIKESNFAATLEKTQKELNGIKMAMGEGFKDVFLAAMQSLIAFLNILRALPGFFKENEQWFYALGAAVLAFNAAQIKSTAATLADLAATKAKMVWDKAGLVVMEGQILLTKAWTMAQARATFAGKLAAAGQWLLNAALSANPIGLVVLAIALLTAGIITAYKKVDWFRNGLHAVWGVTKEFGTSLMSVADAVGLFIKSFVDWDLGGIRKSFADLGNAFGNFGKRAGKAWSNGYNSERDAARKDFQNAEDEYDAEQAKKKQAAQDKAWNDQETEEAKRLKSEENRKKAHAAKLTEEAKKAQEEAAKKSAENYKKAADDFAAFREKIAGLEEQAVLDNLEGIDRELAENKKKYADLRTEAELHFQKMKGIGNPAQIAAAGNALQSVNSLEAAAEAKIRQAANDKLAEEKTEFARQLREIDLSESALELVQAEEKYTEMLAKADKFGLDSAVIRERWLAEIAAITDKYSKAEIEKLNRDNKAKSELAVLQAPEGDITAKLAQLAVLRDIELQNEELIESEKALIREKYRLQEVDLKTKQGEDEVKLWSERAGQATQFLGDIFEAEANFAEQTKQERLRKLNEELNSGLISQQAYEAAKVNINSQAEQSIAKTKRKQAIIDKANAIFGATVNTYQGVTAALAKSDFVSAAIIGAMGAAQVIKIASTPLPEIPSVADTKPPAQATAMPLDGYFDGGFTGTGNIREEAGPVHRGEYVTPNAVLRMPEAAPAVSALENLRQGKNVSFGQSNNSANIEGILRQYLGELNAKAVQPSRAHVLMNEFDSLKSDQNYRDKDSEL